MPIVMEYFPLQPLYDLVKDPDINTRARKKRGRPKMKTGTKTVFIAHPISGDIKGNAARVLAICEKIHSKGIIPVAPYLVSLQYLDDKIVENRELGVSANLECFRRKYIDELWLYGDKISKGMMQEIKLALKLKIPIKARTNATKMALKFFILKSALRYIKNLEKTKNQRRDL